MLDWKLTIFNHHHGNNIPFIFHHHGNNILLAVGLRVIDVLILSDKHKGGGLGGVLGVTRSQGLHLRERVDREEEEVLNTGL